MQKDKDTFKAPDKLYLHPNCLTGDFIDFDCSDSRWGADCVEYIRVDLVVQVKEINGEGQ